MTAYIISTLIFVCLSSISCNIALVLKIRSAKKARTPSLELQEFLADLLGGVGIVAVGRVDPNSIILRSPKQK